tara:strand:+ start:323 stop:559 length:237 start_codon:yes stop_codon:yes gene_type:complete
MDRFDREGNVDSHLRERSVAEENKSSGAALHRVTSISIHVKHPHDLVVSTIERNGALATEVFVTELDSNARLVKYELT